MSARQEKPKDTTFLTIRSTHTNETLQRSPSLGRKFEKNEQGYLVLSLMKMVALYDTGKLNFKEITSLIFAIGQEARHFDVKRTGGMIEDDIFFVLDPTMRTTEEQERLAQLLKDNLINEVTQLTICMAFFGNLKRMHASKMNNMPKKRPSKKQRELIIVSREDITKLHKSLFENSPMERAKKYRDLFEDEKHGRFTKQ